MTAARFDRVVASIDGSDLVIAFFWGAEPEPACLAICSPSAARALLLEVGSALKAGISDGLVTPDE